MSDVIEANQRSAPSHGTRPDYGTSSGEDRPRRASRIAIVAVMVVALALAGLTRDLCASYRRGAGAGGTRANPSGSSLSSMNSYALALLLGGLRGPLVMILWPSSENQKTERNLEDFDTKVEWIRLLQAEFDTVHIFQIWNKAYNISVQMANLSNKYATILDALDYGNKVEAERPNNINILSSIGGVYFDKLGTSQEKDYYKKKLREQSLPHDSKQTKTSRDDPTWRRTEHDVVLDEKWNVLKSFLAPRFPRPANRDVNADWCDGSTLQYLPKFEPYPYGVSPFGFAYNYRKRCQVLQAVHKQHHAQLSEAVLDSGPALALKFWQEDERDRARRIEANLLGLAIPEDLLELDAETIPLSEAHLKTPEERAQATEAAWSYDLATRLGDAADAEYQRHMDAYKLNFGVYVSHQDLARATTALAAGDRDYVRWLLAAASDKPKFAASAIQNYQNAADRYRRHILRYYIQPDALRRVLPANVPHEAVSNDLPAAQVEKAFDVYGSLLRNDEATRNNASEENAEYFRDVERAMRRSAMLAGK